MGELYKACVVNRLKMPPYTNLSSVCSVRASVGNGIAAS